MDKMKAGLVGLVLALAVDSAEARNRPLTFQQFQQRYQNQQFYQRLYNPAQYRATQPQYQVPRQKTMFFETTDSAFTLSQASWPSYFFFANKKGMITTYIRRGVMREDYFLPVMEGPGSRPKYGYTYFPSQPRED